MRSVLYYLRASAEEWWHRVCEMPSRAGEHNSETRREAAAAHYHSIATELLQKCPISFRALPSQAVSQQLPLAHGGGAERHMSASPEPLPQ